MKNKNRLKLYFPQWQGAGIGPNIEAGASTILAYLNHPEVVKIPLSNIPAGKEGKQQFDINNFDAITDQLSRFKKFLTKENPNHLATIGGDCGLEIVPVSYLNSIYPNLGVIWFDAHADINKPCDSPSCNFHGMPLRTLLGEGESNMDSLLFSTIKSSQIHYVGLRDIDKAEQIRIDKGNIYSPRQLNIGDLIKTLRDKHIENLYLHFDFDCLEPKEYDKTYYNVSEGLSIQEAEDCIHELQKNFQVVGSSVLESTALETNDLLPIQGIINALMK